MNEVFVHHGDICCLEVDGICTSTNPQLALMIGTGGAVRDRGGWTIQEECDRIIAEQFRTSGRHFVEPGSVHLTSAGALPMKGVMHCVASDGFHESSKDIIRRCTRHALMLADDLGWDRLGCPVFGTGHVRFPLEESAAALAEELASFAPRRLRACIVTSADRHDAQRVVAILSATLPSVGWWT